VLGLANNASRLDIAKVLQRRKGHCCSAQYSERGRRHSGGAKGRDRHV